MIVKNNTNVEQAINLTDRYGARYTVYLPANRTTEISPTQFTKDFLAMLAKGILVEATEGPSVVHHIIPNVVHEDAGRVTECACDIPNAQGETPAETAESSANDVEPTQVHDPVIDETETSVYTCEVCGAEYASPRGLARHMNKEHPDYKKED